VIQSYGLGLSQYFAVVHTSNSTQLCSFVKEVIIKIAACIPGWLYWFWKEILCGLYSRATCIWGRLL